MGLLRSVWGAEGSFAVTSWKRKGFQVYTPESHTSTHWFLQKPSFHGLLWAGFSSSSVAYSYGA